MRPVRRLVGAALVVVAVVGLTTSATGGWPAAAANPPGVADLLAGPGEPQVRAGIDPSIAQRPTATRPWSWSADLPAPAPAPLRDASPFGALAPAGADLTGSPAAVPLELVLPSVGTTAPVVGVGITDRGAMDAPQGSADASAWREAFWYRGSAVPGDASTAVLAGHVNDPRGRPGTFARLGDLRPGDPIVIRDTRTGQQVQFVVDASTSYTLAEAATPAALEAIYGAGPVAGEAPRPSTDGRAHLTLITCSGTFRGETHDHRLVVTATRT